MVRYSDDLSLLEARNLFFCDAKLGPDGGYRDRWVRVEAKPIPFYFPNWPARVAAARLHDFHHIAAEYDITVGMLRDQLELRAALPSAGATDVGLFLLLCVASVLAWLPLSFLTVILFWLITRAKFQIT